MTCTPNAGVFTFFALGGVLHARVRDSFGARPADALAAGGDLPNLVLGTMPYVEGAARRLGVNMLLLSN
jgi:hypothetical protein